MLEQLDRAGAFARWQRQEAALEAVSSLADLPCHTGRGADRGDADRIVGALVRIAAVDGVADADAALVLVHLLSAGILALAARLNGGYASRRAVSMVVGELTCRIRSFPWRDRTRAHAANLLLDTKHELLGERPKLGQDGFPGDVLLDPFDAAWLSFPASPDSPAGQDFGLDELLCWADRHDVAGADDLRMLVSLHERAGYGTGARHRVAAEFGINERTVRRRRDRTLTALRAAGPRFLRDHAA